MCIRDSRYIMVDEYQDTNHAQYLLVKLLAERSGNLCVVGDDDQSIYKFRGATIENILSFEKTFPKARTIRLEQNYRSTQTILDAANAVIANNVERKGKTLWTENPQGKPISVYTAINEMGEAEYITKQILEEAATRKSVSYTHLDVYKRQGVPRVLRGSVPAAGHRPPPSPAFAHRSICCTFPFLRPAFPPRFFLRRFPEGG